MQGKYFAKGDELKELKGKCLIEIGGDSCASCLAVMPNCSAVAKNFNLNFLKLDVEEDTELIKNFNIDRIPTIILWDEGKILAQCSGYQPQEILELWVEAKLG
ncbi:MAG: thioredoxin family protein [Candidatus Coproplasma sp.]